MSLVFAGVCSHAPGITGRAKRADPRVRDAFYAKLGELRGRFEATKPDALIVIAAEHFANFFMNNMPAYCVGMADSYEGPIEDEQWLAIERRSVPGNAALSRRLIAALMHEIDVAYAEEWKFDHGISVPLHFMTPRYDLPVIPVNINCQGPPLTPLARAYEFGRALRRACDAQPERIALLHGESRGDPNAFESVLTFAPDGAATRIEMRTVFPTKELRDEAVEKYHAIEGGQQTLSNLAAYVTEIVRKGVAD